MYYYAVTYRPTYKTEKDNNRRDHIKTVLAQLHWLHIRARVTFKLATMVFTIRPTHQP